jgi:hypothetical protein
LQYNDVMKLGKPRFSWFLLLLSSLRYAHFYSSAFEKWEWMI